MVHELAMKHFDLPVENHLQVGSSVLLLGNTSCACCIGVLRFVASGGDSRHAAWIPNEAEQFQDRPHY